MVPHTTNPARAALAHTDPTARSLITALERAWPRLTESGARTRVAQHQRETEERQRLLVQQPR